MRLFVFARHAESAANAAHVLSSDPLRLSALTLRGRAQALQLGSQIANIEIDLAVCTRFPRTRQTLDLALQGRDIPVVIEADLDEVRAGVFDGAPIEANWAWKQRHARGERFPGGESLDEAVRRYADALIRLLARKEAVTLIVTTSSRSGTSSRPPR
jgi:broad specificity phosphatase PhoE